MSTEKSSNTESPGPLTVSEDPSCTETPLPSLDTWITPVDRFYIRSHFSKLPDLDVSTYRLVVGGDVRSPLSVGYRELQELPSKEVVATLECAGNSRSYLTPPAEGIGFRHGAVGNARWKGVPVSDLLSRAGLPGTAREVLFEGADFGEEEEEGKTLQLGYARSLPVDVALGPDTIVAYQMNSELLEPAHGYPLRLIVPGWYGMASVKWLKRIEVLDEPYQGFFQNRRYILINEGETVGACWETVTTLRVKSLITHPRHGEVVQPGPYTIRGMSWSGEGAIATVEASTSGGRDWQQARLIGSSVPTAWCQWELTWNVTRPGHYILMSRSTDSADNAQPTSIPWNFRGYANNAIHTIAIEASPG